MIFAPATGCCSSSLASKASAGGQLEQPSDVNNSTTTGVREVCGIPETACAGGRVKAAAPSRLAEMRVKPANRRFIVVFYLPAHQISFSAKGYRKTRVFLAI